jgi:hypothetical protein
MELERGKDNRWVVNREVSFAPPESGELDRARSWLPWLGGDLNAIFEENLKQETRSMTTLTEFVDANGHAETVAIRKHFA